ncbi:WSSV509 [White spot syndrome virus]|uniref:WSSV509 n=1 Tax=White spot syndrome virus TaxID=342409 RepID=A0A2I6SCG8_9VIRU|nr:WSSV509 [White spot syndrome virus]
MIGLGFSADDVMEKLIAIEGNMRKSGLKYTWVPVAEVCHLKNTRVILL